MAFICCRILRSVAGHSSSSPYIVGAQQLQRLCAAHREASQSLLQLHQQQGTSSSSSGRGGSGGSRSKKKKTVTAASSASTSPQLQALEDRCLTIERQFYREVEAFRPIWSMQTAGLGVSLTYSQMVYRAMCYFGCQDDPLMRQLAPLLGRHQMRNVSEGERDDTMAAEVEASDEGEAARESSTAFHDDGPPPAAAASNVRSSNKFTSFRSRANRKGWHGASPSWRPSPHTEVVETVLPEELPTPPQVRGSPSSGGDANWQQRRPVKIPVAFRGHWVLQDPAIALTREERKEDPW